ncbi:glycerol kinase GlpK [Geminicoccus flavidas]|uniref:glycerol kinase GlpK n=1 Tax=Geminicoccus flavidas TaxID=2506407 RepID=UPI0013567D04|nr:glycerol kinase GlpK [Geminicoccus flavidas]
MAGELLLAIDQGTTSTRAILFDRFGSVQASAQQELTQHFPFDGRVEHDGNEIWRDTLAVCRDVLARGDGRPVAAIGITNQRETTLLWERATGRLVHRAIVWQDRRTAQLCRELEADGLGPLVSERTGLVIDPYFSGTKLAWLLDHVPGARTMAERGELAFGTVDSWLLWNLTGGRLHATDATNAARTMLFDIRRQAWDDELLGRLRIPHALLPEVRDSAGDFGETNPSLFGRAIPIRGVAGDQHAATFGQACFTPGMMKSTYGTGCFAVLNTGTEMVASRNRMLTTLCWRLNGQPTYALEGAIFVAGAAIQWVRDGLGVIRTAAETDALARSLDNNAGVYLVPAFTGLGAPYWDPDARGAIFGLTRDTSHRHIVRAALEAVGYQTADLLAAMKDDVTAAGGLGLPAALRVDGGMVANDWVCQWLADICDVPVERPEVIETTALGAAYLAGLGAGLYGGLDDIGKAWSCEQRFAPGMASGERARLVGGWKDAVSRVRSNRA